MTSWTQEGLAATTLSYGSSRRRSRTSRSAGRLDSRDPYRRAAQLQLPAPVPSPSYPVPSMSIQPVLGWAANLVGAGAKVVAVKGLRAGGGPWRLGIDRGGTLLQVVLRVGDPSTRQLLATEAAALVFAEAHQLAAPRLLAADLDGAAAGRPVLLMTFLAGSSTIPTSASRARLRALGAAAATLHAVATAPRPGLPLRVRPLADVDFAAKRRATGSSPLLEAAAERVNEVPMPQGGTGLVHGDLWQGNTLWTGERCVGILDWDAAGIGHPGIDLGTLRLDAAIMFGLPTAAVVLEGWRRAIGQEPAAMAYWDLVAALTTPTDIATWLPVAHDHGRVDLDAVTLNSQRDAFLRAALD
jgi:aminoglycoside phosphotransferase